MSSPHSKNPDAAALPPEIEALQHLIDEPLSLDEIDDAPELVGKLSAQAFVRVTRQLRDENRLDLILPHATPEQLTSLLDLDAWVADQVDIPRARAWVTAIANAYSDARRTRGTLVELIHQMDPEMWTLALTAGTTVVDLDPDDDGARSAAFDQLEPLLCWNTPDGFFVLGVPDDELGRMVVHSVSLVYADDLAEGRKLVLSIQAALPAMIEEDLLRWRTGRLADMGFVPWDEAVKLFRPLDHRAAATQDARDFHYLTPSDDTSLQVGVIGGSGLLRRVMARLPDTEHGLRTREFLLLVNEVMAAQRLPAGDEASQERAIEQTQATLTLGLELLLVAAPNHPDPEAFGAERVTAIGLRDVFRVGYGALDRLRKAAIALHRGARISLSAAASLLDRPWGPAVASLMRWYPELPLQETSSRTRPLRSFADVANATRLIAQASALSRLCFAAEGYGIDAIWITRADEPERLVLGDLIRTAIIHAHLPGSRTTMAPLAPDDLQWAKDHLLDPAGRLASDVRRDFSARCDTLGIGEHTKALAETLLTRLRVELLGLEVEDGKADLTRTGGFLTLQQVGMWLTTSTGPPN